MSKNVTIVTLAYNGMTALPNMLKSIPKETAILILDNASRDSKQLKYLENNSYATLLFFIRTQAFNAVRCWDENLFFS